MSWREVQFAEKKRPMEHRLNDFREHRKMVKDPNSHLRIEQEMRRLSMNARAGQEADRASGKPKWKATKVERIHAPGAGRPQAGREDLWSEKDIGLLKECWEKSANVKELANRVGRAERTCRGKATALGLKRKSFVALSAWTQDDIDILTQMRADGKPYSLIVEKLGRTEDKIKRKATKLGITQKRT